MAHHDAVREGGDHLIALCKRMTRKIEEYLDLFNAFEPCFSINHRGRLNVAVMPAGKRLDRVIAMAHVFASPGSP